MRAAALLQSFAHYFNVYLIVIHAFSERIISDAGLKFLRGLCVATTIVPRSAMVEDYEMNALATFSKVNYAVVHAYRIVMASVVLNYIKSMDYPKPIITLDLDDFESEKYLQIAATKRLSGDIEEAEQCRLAGEKFAALESWYLPLFDLVYVCSQCDRAEVGARYNCLQKLWVIPNAMEISSELIAGPSLHPFTFLFPANMAYAANEDGIKFFCREILPIIRAEAQAAFRVAIVGRRPSSAVLSLSAAHTEVSVSGEVLDMDLYFRAAGAVIVPLRAGSGTRIKILEAWTYCRPVISTTIGAQGLEAVHGRHLLIADSSKEFAQACLLLMNRPAVAREIAELGRHFVRTHFSVLNVRRAVKAALASISDLVKDITDQ